MQRIMFNDKYHLTEAVLLGSKTMTRRVATTMKIKNPLSGFFTDKTDRGKACLCEGYRVVAKSRYRIGEVVAVAQEYRELCDNDAFYEALHKANPTFPLECIKGEAGCDNKMFVRAKWMPHQIKITNIRVEQLQDIQEGDILKEGIKRTVYQFTGKPTIVRYSYQEEVAQTVGGTLTFWVNYDRAREAFAELIDKVSGKGTWERNPWVFVYEFELVK